MGKTKNSKMGKLKNGKTQKYTFQYTLHNVLLREKKLKWAPRKMGKTKNSKMGKLKNGKTQKYTFHYTLNTRSTHATGH